MAAFGEAEGTDRVYRRNSRGSAAKDMYSWPSQEFGDIDTSLATTQYIHQVIHANPADVDAILACPPDDDDDDMWQYEHFRRFVLELNELAAMLTKVCTPLTCPEMIATGTETYLCACHTKPRACSAISYILHNLNNTATLLTSEKLFPSRVNIKSSSLQKLPSLTRRIYRIFAHAFFQHRETFDEFEGRTHLCRRFHAYVLRYELMTADQCTVTLEEAPTEGESGSAVSDC